MAVQFINVESFFFLRKFIGLKNPLMSASIACFVFLRKKNMAAKFKGRAIYLFLLNAVVVRELPWRNQKNDSGTENHAIPIP